MNALAPVLIAVFPLLVIVAALKDVTSFIIPNWISIGLVLAFYPAALAAGAPLGVIGAATAVGVCALLAGMAMFYAGWMGGGDAKLLAGCALWMGWPTVLPFLLAGALAGGVLALILIQMRSALLKPYLQRGPAWMGRLVSTSDAPYGLAIAVGALIMLPRSPLLQAMAG
ncbi:MAG TPA: prepilin peptidase [Candidatus Limnocylindria bacterium]|nr:prepilin peptidase [Candidatus Limnocylindria bacterium]